jgi:spore coat protein CotH
MPPMPSTAPVESSQSARDALMMFDDAKVHDVQLFLSDADWRSILDDDRGDELRRASVTIDGVTVTDVGLRPAGESSRVAGNAKMSMRVEFDAFEDKKMGGFDEIKLSGSWDDPFLIRDRLAYWCYRQIMPAPREVAARLWVNGEPRGIFEIEEIWGRETLSEWFADATGPLYRLRGLTNQDPYEYKGTDPAVYVPLPWDPKGMRDPSEHMVIGAALRVLAEEPARLDEVMDVQMLFNYFAMSAILANTDGFTGPFEVDDHFQYWDPTKQKFFILPWDPDNTFGSINDLPTSDIFLNYERSILARYVRDQLRGPYLDRLEAIMGQLPAQTINAQAETFAAQIRPSVQDDGTKMYPTDSFEWSLGYIKDFTTNRYASIREQIATLRAAQQPPPPDSTPPPDATPPPDTAGGQP